jgi:hypothetical protein
MLTLKKISKLPIFVQKYLINILAMLYFLFFQEMSFHLYFNILHNHPHHI